MPVYSYACKSCGHTFDIHQEFSDASLTICPECQGRLKKVFGAVGVSFKGSGFYSTDSHSSKSSTVPATSASKPAETPSAAPATAPAAAPAAN